MNARLAETAFRPQVDNQCCRVMQPVQTENTLKNSDTPLCSIIFSYTALPLLITASLLWVSLTSGRGAAKGKLLSEARRTRGEAEDSPHAVWLLGKSHGEGACVCILVCAVERGHGCAMPATVLSGQVLTSASTLRFIGWEWVSLWVDHA